MHRVKYWHPQRPPQGRLADQRQPRPLRRLFAGVLKGRNEANVGGQSIRRAEPRGIVELGHQTRRRRRANSFDGGKQTTDLMIVEQRLDYRVDGEKPGAPERQVLAGMPVRTR